MSSSAEEDSQTQLSPEKEHLITLYAKDVDVPEDSWPPKVNSTFINLVLIKKMRVITHAYQYSVRGDVDDILEMKEKIEYDTVFGEYKSGALVLVEGRPGSGKTTLVHKVSRDWATGGKILTSAKLVLHIPLRQLANRKTQHLSDLLDLLYHDREECEKVVRDIKQSNGKGTCFILDGLDEFHPQDETKSVIHQLLNRKYLPAAMVIVTSRPVATDKLRCKLHVTKRIEVLGFSHQQILDYIDTYPFTTDTSSISAAQLKAYLNFHPNLLRMCYLPINVAMICFLYEWERGNIPQTETKIYEHFTQYIVLRNLRRTNENAQLDSLDDLRGNDRRYFNKICELALDMTAHSRQSVCQRDTQVQLPLGTGCNDALTLGLVTVDRSAYLQRLDNTYTFLHLTFQEFLAAFYLSQLKEEQQIKMIKLYAGEPQMQMVWKFYFGLVKFENEVAQIQHISSARKVPRHDALYATQCAFEAKQQVLCDNIVKECTGDLSYSGCILTLADVTGVGYVISTTSHRVTKLAMSGCDLHNEHVRTLLENISHNKLEGIQELHFHGNNIGDYGAELLANHLKTCSSLRTLDLSQNNISDNIAAALAEGLKSFFTLFQPDTKKYEDYLQFIKTKETVDLPFLKIVFLGPPGLGKTTTRRRLMGEIDDLWSAGEAGKSHPSTGAVESATSVMVRCLTSTTAVVTESQWSTMDSRSEELRMLLDKFHHLIETKPTSADNEETTSTPPVMTVDEDTASQLTVHPSIQRESSPLSAPSSVTPLGTPLSVPSSVAPPTSSQHEDSAEVDALIIDAMNAENLKAIMGSLKAYLRMVDTGGQPELMDMLPALTAGPGLYLLFVDLQCDLQKKYKVCYRSCSGESTAASSSTSTVEESLLSALSSISCSTPSTCPTLHSSMEATDSVKENILKSSKSIAYIVGTHKDKVTDEEVKEFDQKLQKVIESTNFYKGKKRIIQYSSTKPKRLVVAMDNMKGGTEEIHDLRQILEKAIEKHFKKLSIPLSWLAFSLSLRMSAVKTATLKHCLKLSMKFKMSEDETKLALWFLHHHAGIMMYFPDIPLLEDLVIIDPQVVYDSVTEVILRALRSSEQPSISEDFTETGQFSLEDLEEVTAKIVGDYIQVDKLLALLKFLHIVARFPYDGSEIYIMPCVLKSASREELDTDQEDDHYPDSLLPIMIRYKCGFVPIGVFPAITASFIGGKPLKLIKEGIKKNRVQFNFGPDADKVTFITRPTYYEIRIARMRNTKRQPHEVCRDLRRVVESTFKEVSDNINYGSIMDYQFSFECPSHPGREHLCVIEEEETSPHKMFCLGNPKKSTPYDMEADHLVWYGEPLPERESCSPGGTAKAVSAEEGLRIKESQVFQSLFGKLVSVLESRIESVADQCYSQYLIAEQTYKSVMELNLLRADKARTVLINVKENIAHQHGAWGKFLAILENEIGCECLLEDMRSELQLAL